MDGLNQQLVDHRQQLRAQETDIVDNGLPLLFIFHDSVPRDLAHKAVMVGIVGELVIVAVQPLFEGRQHQNAPQVHAQPAGILAYVQALSSAKTCSRRSAVTYRCYKPRSSTGKSLRDFGLI